MTIKHLVLGGGGPVGLIMYGALKELYIKGVWKFENIKSIFATSIGTWLSLVVLARLDWEWIDDFFIKRPWEKLINISTKDYLDIFQQKGFLDRNIISKCISPLLKAADFDENITMMELYNKTGIDIHFFTANINSPEFIENIDMSHRTYPNLTLIDAVCRSSSFPLIFKPIFEDNKCLVDGGIINNFPVDSCLSYYPNKDEILALKFERGEFERNITQDTSTFDHILYYITSIGMKLLLITSNMQTDVPNNVLCYCDKNISSLKYWFEAFSNQKEREYLINSGVLCAEKFFNEK